MIKRSIFTRDLNFGITLKISAENSNFFGKIWRQNFYNSNFSGNLRSAFHSDLQILGEKIFQKYFWRKIRNH